MNTQIQKIGRVLSKNSPTILTALSVAGVFGTAIMAAKATPRALEILEEESYRRHEKTIHPIAPLTRKEIVKLTWKCYAPAAAMGVATITCIIGAHSVSLRRNAALASMYSLSEKVLKEYQSKVIENIGQEREKDIRDEIAIDRVHRNPINKNEVIMTGTGETLCYDALSGRYFKSDMETIRAALNSLSRRLMNDMFVSLNDIYDELGLEGTKLGDLVGWHIDQVGTELIGPDFSTQISEDGRPCLVLDFDIEPKYFDRDY